MCLEVDLRRHVFDFHVHESVCHTISMLDNSILPVQLFKLLQTSLIQAMWWWTLQKKYYWKSCSDVQWCFWHTSKRFVTCSDMSEMLQKYIWFRREGKFHSDLYIKVVPHFSTPMSSWCKGSMNPRTKAGPHWVGPARYQNQNIYLQYTYRHEVV